MPPRMKKGRGRGKAFEEKSDMLAADGMTDVSIVSTGDAVEDDSHVVVNENAESPNVDDSSISDESPEAENQEGIEYNEYIESTTSKFDRGKDNDDDDYDSVNLKDDSVLNENDKNNPENPAINGNDSIGDHDAGDDDDPTAVKKRSIPDSDEKDSNAPKKKSKDEGVRLFIRPILQGTTSDDIKEFFNSNNMFPSDTYIPIKRGKSKGYGFAGFSKIEDAKAALSLSGLKLKDTEVTIVLAVGREFPKAEDVSNVLFVKNVPIERTPETLKPYFPTAKEIRLLKKDDGTPRGICFVEYDTPVNAAEAKILSKDLEIDGKVVEIEYANPKGRKRDLRSKYSSRDRRSGMSRYDDYGYRRSGGPMVPPRHPYDNDPYMYRGRPQYYERDDYDYYYRDRMYRGPPMPPSRDIRRDRYDREMMDERGPYGPPPPMSRGRDPYSPEYSHSGSRGVKRPQFPNPGGPSSGPMRPNAPPHVVNEPNRGPPSSGQGYRGPSF